MLVATIIRAECGQFTCTTKKGGATLTALMGTSAWLAPGAGTCLMVEAIVRNQKRVLPCSVELQGEFGVKDAFVGVPVVLSAKGAERVLEFELSASEKEAFTKSVAANVELMTIARGFLARARARAGEKV